MKNSMPQWVRKAASVIALCYAGVKCERLCQLITCVAFFSLLSTSGCSWLDAKQRHIIYRPSLGVPADFAGLREGDERYFVNLARLQDQSTPASMGEAQRIEMWRLPHTEKNAPTLLYFHGTFRNLYQNLHKIEALREAGFSVLAVEYRGWGQSSAMTPSERSILQDADAAWTELQRRESRANQRVIYGHSMGSGVAVDLASRLQAPSHYGGLILESALTSFADVANQAGWWARALASFHSERFASIEKMPRITAPLLMIHGSMDTTVPIQLGEKLFATANGPKLWMPIEGGMHSNAHQAGGAQYQAALRSFKNTYMTGR